MPTTRITSCNNATMADAPYRIEFGTLRNDHVMYSKMATDARATAIAALRPISRETAAETDENSMNWLVGLPSVSRKPPKRSLSASSSSSRSEGRGGPTGGVDSEPSISSVRTRNWLSPER